MVFGLVNDIVGSSGNDMLAAGSRGDRLLGRSGRDTFRLDGFIDSRLRQLDRIKDFELGTDILEGPRKWSQSQIAQRGRVRSLSANAIRNVLTSQNFRAGQGATF